MQSNTKTDWRALIATLRSSGWRQKAICDRVGLAQGTLHDLQNQRHQEPRYTAGRALVSLYREVFDSEPPVA